MFRVGFVIPKPLSPKHRSTFLPLQHAATLILSVDWGLGSRPGVDYYVKKPSKRIRLLRAVQTKHQESGSAGVLQLIKTLYPMEEYAENPDEFREFCRGLNRILRFSGVEYRDDGEFHRVTPTRDLTEAERRARAMENKLASRRVHSEVQRYCKAQYMKENYFHAVFEAAKGLAERIREKTGLKIDGVNLIREIFERPKGGFPILAINALETETELNEHDGLTNLIMLAWQLQEHINAKWRIPVGSPHVSDATGSR